MADFEKPVLGLDWTGYRIINNTLKVPVVSLLILVKREGEKIGKKLGKRNVFPFFRCADQCNFNGPMDRPSGFVIKA